MSSFEQVVAEWGLVEATLKTLTSVGRSGMVTQLYVKEETVSGKARSCLLG